MTGAAGRRASDQEWPELMRSLGRIEAKIDALECTAVETKGNILATNKRLDDHQSASLRAGGLMGLLASAGIALTVELAKRGLHVI